MLDASPTTLLWMNLIRLLASGLEASRVPTMVFERMAATVFVKDYEVNPRRWISFLIVCGHIVATLFSIWFYETGWRSAAKKM